MRDPYDDDLSSDEPSSDQRWLRHVLIAGLAGGLIAGTLLIGLLRWPATGGWLRPILIGEGATAVATPTHTPAPTPQRTPAAPAVPQSSGTTSTPPPRETHRSPSFTPTSAAPSPSNPTPEIGLGNDRLAELRRVMLSAINEDRAARGLSTVGWDDVAAAAGQTHADDMLGNSYFSHRNLAGYGPEHRYALAGGSDAIAENIYSFWYRFDDGRAAPIADWNAVIRKAQAELMNSPGHRRTILDPFHTHVGVGIAYDAQKGELRLAQEFVSRWVRLEALPRRLAVGSSATISGTLLGEARNPLINLAYQPFPTPLTAASVPSGSYESTAQVYEAVKPDSTGRRFTSKIRIDREGHPGLYSIRLWVEINGKSTLATEFIVWAE